MATLAAFIQDADLNLFVSGKKAKGSIFTLKNVGIVAGVATAVGAALAPTGIIDNRFFTPSGYGVPFVDSSTWFGKNPFPLHGPDNNPYPLHGPDNNPLLTKASGPNEDDSESEEEEDFFFATDGETLNKGETLNEEEQKLKETISMLQTEVAEQEQKNAQLKDEHKRRKEAVQKFEKQFSREHEQLQESISSLEAEKKLQEESIKEGHLILQQDIHEEEKLREKILFLEEEKNARQEGLEDNHSLRQQNMEEEKKLLDSIRLLKEDKIIREQSLKEEQILRQQEMISGANYQKIMLDEEQALMKKIAQLNLDAEKQEQLNKDIIKNGKTLCDEVAKTKKNENQFMSARHVLKSFDRDTNTDNFLRFGTPMPISRPVYKEPRLESPKPSSGDIDREYSQPVSADHASRHFTPEVKSRSRSNSPPPSRARSDSPPPSRSRSNSPPPSRARSNSPPPSHARSNSPPPSHARSNSPPPSSRSISLADTAPKFKSPRRRSSSPEPYPPEKTFADDSLTRSRSLSPDLFSNAATLAIECFDLVMNNETTCTSFRHKLLLDLEHCLIAHQGTFYNNYMHWKESLSNHSVTHRNAQTFHHHERNPYQTWWNTNQSDLDPTTDIHGHLLMKVVSERMHALKMFS
jgi:hypothetical protein